MHPAYTRGYLYIITPFSLKKRDNSVGSVGVLENFLLGDLWGLFGFAYTTNTAYTVILLL